MIIKIGNNTPYIQRIRWAREDIRRPRSLLKNEKDKDAEKVSTKAMCDT